MRKSFAAFERVLAPMFRWPQPSIFMGISRPRMAESANILIGYQTYPHIDQRQRGLLAAELLTRMVRKEVRPVCHIAKPPMLMHLTRPGHGTRANDGIDGTKPGAAETRPGVLSVSLMAGFPYADVPDMGASVIVVADGDKSLAESVANELSAAMWAVREQLNVPCPKPVEAVIRATASGYTPVLLIDLGDNIGGGSAGDGTVLLAELLATKSARVSL